MHPWHTSQIHQTAIIILIKQYHVLSRWTKFWIFKKISLKPFVAQSWDRYGGSGWRSCHLQETKQWWRQWQIWTKRQILRPILPLLLPLLKGRTIKGNIAQCSSCHTKYTCFGKDVNVKVRKSVKKKKWKRRMHCHTFISVIIFIRGWGVILLWSSLGQNH